MHLENDFTRRLGIRYPIICGAMYPCSNPELVAAVSEAGGIGVVQPLSLTYVYGNEMRAGLQKIRAITKKPIGMNVLIEKTAKVYEDRMKKYVDIALEENVRFFVTALGNPKWVVDRVHAAGGTVFHDVTDRRWALKAREQNVDGFICVNNRAGGHAGGKSPEELMSELSDLGLPLVCAGGVGSPEDFAKMLKLGYLGVQMGTRFIATKECLAGDEYKKAILAAKPEDIVLTERLTGVPVAVINTPMVKRFGTKAGPIARLLLRHPKGKRWVRTWYAINSLRHFKRTMVKPLGYNDYWQAGKSVASIDKIEKAGDIVAAFARGASQA